jgi:hypothetical protein
VIPQVLSQVIEAHRRSMFNPIENLEPADLARQLTEFKAGSLRDLALTMEAIEERDDVLSGLVPKAKAAVSRHGYEINVVEKIPAGMEQLAVRQKAALENFWNNITVRNALEPDEEGEFSLLVRQMMDAKGKRYSVHHIVWRPLDDGGYTAELIHVPLWFFENRTGPMRFIASPYGYDGVALAPGAWCVTVGLGIMRACAVAWMFKRMSLQDWVGYNEKHGFPGVHGQTNAAYGSAEWKQMVEAVAAFSRDWSAVTNMEGKINLIEAKGSGALPFPPLVERMDRALSALWRGADLSTMSAGGGSGQGASLQGKEADIIECDDAAWIGETMRRKIERRLLDYTFGPGVPALAYIKVKTAQRPNTDQDLKIDTFLVANGHPLSQKQAAERYDRPLPEAGDVLLKPAPAAAPAPFGGGVPGFNEKPADARAALFRAEALKRLSAAQAAALRPLVRRVLAVADLPDAEFDAGVARLREQLPTLAKEILAGDATGQLAKAWESILAPALVSGAAEAAQKQNAT